MCFWHRSLLLLLALLSRASALEVPPKFTVDLSRPPAERWRGALGAILAKHAYEDSFARVFAWHNRTVFHALHAEQWTILGSAVRRHWPETAAELSGIQADFKAAGHAEVTFEYLAGWLYFHELLHSSDLPSPGQQQRECTGILAAAEDGSVLHGGNMDQSPPAARNLTLHVRFVDGSGQLVFEGVDFYAILSTGVSRAVRKGLASVQENWRHGGYRPLAQILADIDGGVISQMLVFRNIFVGAHSSFLATGVTTSFDDFVEEVTKVRLAAPFYAVAGGPLPWQGAVIARTLSGADRINRLENQQQLSDFFLCETNFEHWLPDDPTDPRRTACELTMRNLGQTEGASMLGLLAATSTYPVHNPTTAYTVLMNPATGELHAYVRQAMCPVDPGATVVVDARYAQYCAAVAPAPAPVHIFA